jgi:hypothetical protein
MSVQSAADDARDSAKQSIKDAITSLNSIVVDEIWGTSDYSDEYKKKLSDVLSDLIRVHGAM